jgi:N-carbamoylputrescine amidase
MTARIKVAAVQFAPAKAPRAQILEQAGGDIRQAAEVGAGIVLLPELFAWPYFAGQEPSGWIGEAEAVDGPTASWAGATAAGAGVALLAPVFLQEAEGHRSNAVLLARSDGAVSVVARKIHLPPSGGDAFGEADHFTAGPPEIVVFEAAGLKAAVLVCYDRRFPECWRAAREGGADVVFVPVAGPAEEAPDFFIAEIRTHARESGVWAVAASRAGIDRFGDEEVRHDGDTLVVAPDGDTLVVAPDGDVVTVLRRQFGRGLVTADIDLARLRACRDRFPTFDQRRAIKPAPSWRTAP